MKAIITHGANKGMLGGVTFTLDVKVLLDESEKALVDKHKLGSTILYDEAQDYFDQSIEFILNSVPEV